MSHAPTPHPPAPDPPGADATTVLRLDGRDALGLLQRLSTQAVTDLEPGHARWTLFCDFRGRLLHRALVAVTADRAAWLLRDDAPGVGLAAHIHRHVFREEVRIGMAGARWSARLVSGSVGLEPGRVRDVEGVPQSVQVTAEQAMVLVPPGTPPTDVAHESARILSGHPRDGHEIAEAFNPYEVNLAHEVHLAKGCYTGQEALQRLVTYGSVRRHLARVEGEGPAPVAPAPIAWAAGPAGVLTSAVGLADASRWIGLAVLRHEACEAGVRMTLGGVRAITRVEPFALTRPLGLP